jgi:prepilin-type N-terminal cleavage/methylation domain-containing protein
MLRIKDKADERYQRGVTITELLVVIAIMAIVAAVAVVSISDTVRRSRLREATRELEGDFSTIRNTARTRQLNVVALLTATDITAFFDINSNGVYDIGVDYFDMNGNSVYDAGVDTDGRFLHHAFTNGVQFAVASIPGAGSVAPLTTIRFNTMGSIIDANRVVTITIPSEAKRQYRIWVYQTGSTRVERSEDAGVTWPTRPW